ncbi:MAG: S16 family serine protease [Deltaproteobacteria bacterium]|nr:S16 family serine protease [Deltaproteobacteria bacterium]
MEIPDELPILPIRETTLYPKMILPLMVSQEPLIKLIDAALLSNKLVGIVAIKSKEVGQVKPEDLFEIGCAAYVFKMIKVPNSSIRLLIQGTARIRLTEFTQREPYIRAKVIPLQDTVEEKGDTPAQAALSYVRSNSKALKIPENFFDNSDIHIHVPAGAIPKDGPSAGVTMFTALTSLLTGKPVRNDVAMTGEITLRGLVLPVGGIKEKVLAARRAGITTVILPKKNEKDLEEVPEQVKKDMQFHFVQRMDEVIQLALKKKPKK